MSKFNKRVIRLKKSDFWRVLLSETGPFEVPIIFSNDGFYQNMKDLDSKTDSFKNFIDALILSKYNYTIPFKYNVNKTLTSVRTLSLIHPNGQVKCAYFYHKFAPIISHYASQSDFSIRRPVKIGSKYYHNTNLIDTNKYKQSAIDTLKVDAIAKNPASYLAYPVDSHTH